VCGTTLVGTTRSPASEQTKVQDPPLMRAHRAKAAEALAEGRELDAFREPGPADGFLPGKGKSTGRDGPRVTAARVPIIA